MSTLAKIVAVTQPLVAGVHNAEQFIAYAARVSNPANQNNHQTAEDLCKYMIRNNHWSPFEMVSVTMEINTTRDIARQILRHRSFSFQEFSQRYSDQISFAASRPARLQDQKNRQNSVDVGDRKDLDWWEKAQAEFCQTAGRLYEQAIEEGVAKEVARSVLPEGLTTSRLYMAGTLRSWIHYTSLRTGNGTQREHMEVAHHAKQELYLMFPSVMAAVDNAEKNIV